eukprot:4594939-Amphidinium_carterae.1
MGTKSFSKSFHSYRLRGFCVGKGAGHGTNRFMAVVAVISLAARRLRADASLLRGGLVAVVPTAVLQ